MTLRQKQSKFAHMVALLLLYIYEQGYEVTLGDAARIDGEGHRDGSCHYIRLAIDLNLFKNGRYLQNTAAYRFVGEFWEGLGGAWGGRFSDGNHFALEHEGRK